MLSTDITHRLLIENARVYLWQRYDLGPDICVVAKF